MPKKSPFFGHRLEAPVWPVEPDGRRQAGPGMLLNLKSQDGFDSFVWRPRPQNRFVLNCGLYILRHGR